MFCCAVGAIKELRPGRRGPCCAVCLVKGEVIRRLSCGHWLYMRLEWREPFLVRFFLLLLELTRLLMALVDL